MKLKDLLNKSKNLSISRLSIKIVFTVLVIFATLTISLSNNFEFINTTLPTWLTALGTIGAVLTAVGQTVIHNRKTEKEYIARSNNARKFISAMLSTHKMYFAHFHELRYGNDNFDIIENGDFDDLRYMRRVYHENDILKRAHDCLDDIKFAIRNVGIQTDSATVEALSNQINDINCIETALSAIEKHSDAHFKGKIDTETMTDSLRNNLRIIDVSLQNLAKDLTDKAFVDSTTVFTLGEINYENENNSV